MWVGFAKIKISVFGAKMVRNPETPGIGLETPDLEVSGGNSGLEPGNSGLGGSDTPGIGPDIPDPWKCCQLVWACFYVDY